MNYQFPFAFPLPQQQPTIIIINNYITNQYNNSIPEMNTAMPLTPPRPVRELVAPGAPPRRKRGRVMVDSDSEDEQSYSLVFPDIDDEDEGVRRIDALIFPEMDMTEISMTEMDMTEMDMTEMDMTEMDMSDEMDMTDAPHPNINIHRGNYRSPVDDSDSELEVDDESDDDESDPEDQETVVAPFKDPDAMDIDDDDTVYLY